MRESRATDLKSEKVQDSHLEGVFPITHKSYHELAEIPVVEVDCISQLQSNIEMLSDLQSRLSFLMREVRYLMKV
jgi:hypothetical protein